MEPVLNHSWKLSEGEAIDLQFRLAPKVIRHDYLDAVTLVAGVDVAYDKKNHKLVAAVVVLEYPTLQIVESVVVEDKANFPYIPGLFSFRELPPLIKAFAVLKRVPDLVVCDGQGIAHPRRFGLACHLGLVFDVPTIGCGKSRLIGESDPLGGVRGAASHLVDKGEVIGSVLRTQSNVNPVYVSIGHRISLPTACDWILRLTSKYRLPETTRAADQLVKRALA